MTVSSVGSAGRQYSTAQLWEAAAPANLISSGSDWIGECYNDSEFLITSASGGLQISGSTSDSTHRKILTVAAGQGLKDKADKNSVPLRFDSSRGVAFYFTEGFYQPFVFTEPFCEVRWIQVQARNAPINRYAILDSGSSIVFGILLDFTPGCTDGSAGGFSFSGSSGDRVNCAVVMRAPLNTIGDQTGFSSTPPYDIGLTVLGPTDVSPAANMRGILSTGSSQVRFLCDAVFLPATSGLDFTVGSPLATPSGGNASSDGSAANTGTSGTNRINLTPSNELMGTTLANVDLRVKSGSILINNGVYDAKLEGVDILNNPRSLTTPTIGCYEFQQSAPAITGALAATEALDLAAFTGAKTFAGSLAVTEARDVAAFSGTNTKLHSGTLAASEMLDVAAFSGSITNPAAITGSLDATEMLDVAAFSGAKTFFGSLAATEALDVAAFAGTMIPKFHSGSLAALEPLDVAALQGSVFSPNTIIGALAATETPDVAAFSGMKTFVGTLGALEDPDEAAFQGMVVRLVSGALAAIEQLDIAFFNGATPEDQVANSIVMRDGNMGIGISPQTQWQGGAPSWDRATSDGEVEFPNALGQNPKTDNFTDNLQMRQARLLQALGDTPAGTDVLPGWYTFIDVKAGEWCWCLSRTNIAAEDDNPIGKTNAQALGAPVGQSARTLGNTMIEPKDKVEFVGTVVHPEKEET